MLNFENTAIAFSNKTNSALKKARFLFKLISSKLLSSIGMWLAITALKLNLPFSKWLIKATVYEQFCGGESLETSLPAIKGMEKHNVKVILDYAVEAKSSEADFINTQNAIIKGIKYAGTNFENGIVSLKLTGHARFALLEKIHNKEVLNKDEQAEYERFAKRIDEICQLATDNNVQVYIDAEETWIQNPIDEISEQLMGKYNIKEPVVFNTHQLYRHDRLAFLKASLERAKVGRYILGAKLVRGAYMEQERERAKEMEYPSPIQKDKEATDRDYNLAIEFCFENLEHIALCMASHNEKSNYLLASLIEKYKIDINHPHLVFSQLYGMSDHITYNLAEAKFNSYKFLPYGPVKEVIPYLKRRAEENTSIAGQMNKELLLISKELDRRKQG